MELITRYQRFFTRLTEYYSTFIRFLLNILLFIICIGLIVGIYKTGHDFYLSLDKNVDKILQGILLDVVFIVALVEITITILGYLKDGKVRVRYIVDTILIIMLNEIISLWFKHPNIEQTLGLCAIILTLAIVRVTSIKFSPKSD